MSIHPRNAISSTVHDHGRISAVRRIEPRDSASNLRRDRTDGDSEDSPELGKLADGTTEPRGRDWFPLQVALVLIAIFAIAFLVVSFKPLSTVFGLAIGIPACMHCYCGVADHSLAWVLRKVPTSRRG